MHSKIIVALDFHDKKSALDFAQNISPDLCHLKIGKGMFTQYGPDFVRELVNRGFSVFLDLKFHDIPNTVFDACTAAANLGVWMINVHVSGGEAMLKAARAAVDQFPPEKRPLLIGVTVLTSLEAKDLVSLGIEGGVEDTVLRYALLAKESGLDGVVCSAQEAAILRQTLGPAFILVTPGIQLPETEHNDQKRIMTPTAAVAAGADYLVIGRAITQDVNPGALLMKVKKAIF